MENQMMAGQKCPVKMVACLLLLVGGVNWGLVGLGMLLNTNLNLVNLLLGRWSIVESVVYLLVGVSALLKLAMWAKCHKASKCCGGEKCDVSPEVKM